MKVYKGETTSVIVGDPPYVVIIDDPIVDAVWNAAYRARALAWYENIRAKRAEVAKSVSFGLCGHPEFVSEAFAKFPDCNTVSIDGVTFKRPSDEPPKSDGQLAHETFHAELAKRGCGGSDGAGYWDHMKPARRGAWEAAAKAVRDKRKADEFAAACNGERNRWKCATFAQRYSASPIRLWAAQLDQRSKHEESKKTMNTEDALKGANVELDTLRDELSDKADELSETRQELETLKATHARVTAERDRALGYVETHRRERDEARLNLTAARISRDHFKADLDAASKELTSLRGTITTAANTACKEAAELREKLAVALALVEEFTAPFSREKRFRIEGRRSVPNVHERSRKVVLDVVDMGGGWHDEVELNVRKAPKFDPGVTFDYLPRDVRPGVRW